MDTSYPEDNASLWMLDYSLAALAARFDVDWGANQRANSEECRGYSCLTSLLSFQTPYSWRGWGFEPLKLIAVAFALSTLDAATIPRDIKRPGSDSHPLKGGLSDYWSVINGNWRLTFAVENGDAMLVGYHDYH